MNEIDKPFSLLSVFIRVLFIAAIQYNHLHGEHEDFQ